MKKTLKLLAFIAVGAAMLAACGDGYKTTESGKEYKLIEENKNGQLIQIGDVLVGTYEITLGDSVILPVAEPQRFWQVAPSKGYADINEVLLMMHLGDKAIVRISADSLARLGARMPDFYKEGTGMMVSYKINVTDIVTKDEMDQERAIFEENMHQQHEMEMDSLAQYVAEHGIKATPDDEGLYIIVNKKGNGPKVEIGSSIAVNYTGRLLDGRIFDTNVETVAKENGTYNPNGNYAPFSYIVGKASLIRGWERGIINQPAGSKLTLIMPSSLGYGPQDNGVIPANSPLIFDIDILSVSKLVE